VSVAAGSGKVTATMTAGTGGTPTSYTVTAYTTAGVVAGTACTVTVAPWSCDVTGLTNGTPYTVTVTAANAAGTSTVPAVSASVTPTGVFKQTYALGAAGPAGGLVFYFSTDAFTSKGSTCNDSCHYLEAWAMDSPTPTNGAQWCSNDDVAGTFGTAIGSGYENTRQMLAGCAAYGGAASAAKSTTPQKKGVTFSDWFLPSKDELNELYKARGKASTSQFPFSTTKFYWSSSKYSPCCAWIQGFRDGIVTNKGYFESTLVRQVRAF
jgi:hypothetical protein